MYIHVYIYMCVNIFKYIRNVYMCVYVHVQVMSASCNALRLELAAIPI